MEANQELIDDFVQSHDIKHCPEGVVKSYTSLDECRADVVSVIMEYSRLMEEELDAHAKKVARLEREVLEAKGVDIEEQEELAMKKHDRKLHEARKAEHEEDYTNLGLYMSYHGHKEFD